jgi:hypothetical protein
MTKEEDIQRLDEIIAELAKIRNAHGTSAYNYYVAKAEYEIAVAEWFVTNPDVSGTKGEKDMQARLANKDKYKAYKEAHGKLEGYDRSVENLNGQRFAIGTKINREKKD